MELAEGGDLNNKLKKFKANKIYFEEKMIWSYSIQIIYGIKVLHDINLLHRDLKPANIFINKD